MNSLVDMFASDEEIMENKEKLAAENNEAAELRNSVMAMISEWAEIGMKGFWNGKVYSGNTVYVGNVKHVISQNHADIVKNGTGFQSIIVE